MISSRFGRLMTFFLGESRDWFLCFYPGNTGCISKVIIRRLVNKINFDEHNIEKIKNIDDDAIVVFASKNKRVLDFLYYHTKLKNLGLRYPQIAFDFKFFLLLPVKRLFQILVCQIDHFCQYLSFKDAYSSGFAVNQLMDGKGGFVSLIEEDDFHKRFVKSKPDPLSLLIDLQKSTDKPVVFIPENIIYFIKPVYQDEGPMEIIFGTHERPGRIRRYMTILRHPTKIKVEIAQPVNLKEFLNRPEIEQLDAEFQTHRLRSHLVHILNRQLRSVTGPVLKTRQ